MATTPEQFADRSEVEASRALIAQSFDVDQALEVALGLGEGSHPVLRGTAAVHPLAFSQKRRGDPEAAYFETTRRAAKDYWVRYLFHER